MSQYIFEYIIVTILNQYTVIIFVTVLLNHFFPYQTFERKVVQANKMSNEQSRKNIKHAHNASKETFVLCLKHAIKTDTNNKLYVI